MKKSEMAERVADRMGLSKSAAEGAVDAVFETIVEALAREEAVRIAGFRHVRDEGPERAHRTEPADRGEHRDPGLESAVVQGGQGAQGGGQRRAGGRRPAGRTGDRDPRAGSTRRTVRPRHYRIERVFAWRPC